MLGAGEGRLVEVVLDEDDASSEPTDRATAEGTAPRKSTPHPRRRRRWWLIAAALATGAVLVDVVADRRAQQEVARFAHVPGVVAPLIDPVEPVWTVPTAAGVWAHRGLVMTAEPDGGVLGRDSRTGDVRWSMALPAGSDVAAIGCLLAPGDDIARAVGVCNVPDPPDAPDDDDDLHVFGTSDGRPIRTMPLPPTLVGVAAVDRDLVMVERTAAGVTAYRQDVVDDREVWRVELDGLSWPGQVPDVYATGDVVVVRGTTTAVLSVRDGQVLGRWDAPRGDLSRGVVRVVGLPGEGFGVWTSEARGRWYSAAGQPGAALHGAFAGPSVADGSPPGVVLLQSSDGEHLSAVEVTTGARLWRRAAPGRVLLSLGGRLVTISDEGMLRGVDARTGDQLWSVRLDGDDEARTRAPFTDGVRVLVTGRAADGGSGLTAYRIADGRRLWDASLPDGAGRVSVMGDRLVAVDDDPSTLTPGARLTVLG